MFTSCNIPMTIGLSISSLNSPVKLSFFKSACSANFLNSVMVVVQHCQQNKKKIAINSKKTSQHVDGTRRNIYLHHLLITHVPMFSKSKSKYHSWCIALRPLNVTEQLNVTKNSQTGPKCNKFWILNVTTFFL